jgi:hypothetical protein
VSDDKLGEIMTENGQFPYIVGKKAVELFLMPKKLKCSRRIMFGKEIEERKEGRKKERKGKER